MTETFVTVATFSHSIEAHVARIKLESEGIFCVIADENAVNANWLYSNLLGGVKLRVRPSDLERAKKLLEIPSDFNGERCPKCNSRGIFGRTVKKPLGFWSWLLFNFPLPAKKEWSCGACGHRW
jgi:hypothetical protein